MRGSFSKGLVGSQKCGEPGDGRLELDHSFVRPQQDNVSGLWPHEPSGNNFLCHHGISCTEQK
jgi:hypothetical protein